MTATRVPCGFGAKDVVASDVRVVRLAPQEDGYRREALVLRDEAGTLRVWRNRCRHLPVLLDAGSHSFVDARSDDLVCNTHGARYRRSDGVCTWGPCVGKALEPVAFEDDGPEMVLLDEGR